MPKRKICAAPARAAAPATPLRDKTLLDSASASLATELMQSPERTMTAMQFCLGVLHERLGLKDYAVGQWERTMISTARKAALGERDAQHIVKPPPAVAVDVPSIEEAVEALPIASKKRGQGSAASAAPSRDALRQRIEALLDVNSLKEMERNGGIVRPLLTNTEVAIAASELATDTFSTATTYLRESSGTGRGGAYSAVRLSGLPLLSALSTALADALRSTTGCGDLGDKVLATRYGAGGINWAHQDQSAHPCVLMKY